MSPKDINQAAHRLIADKIGNGEIVHMHWAVTELINEQGEIDGEGTPFYDLCAREHLYRVVKSAVDKYEKPNQSGDEQMTLDGYECLQQAYTVKREGVRQLVPIHLVTDEEILDRIEEFEKQTIGLITHTRELKMYLSRRQNNKVVSA